MRAVHAVRVPDVPEPDQNHLQLPARHHRALQQVGAGGRREQALVVVLLGLLVRYVNGCDTFWCGALTAYALWVVVNWFDAFVMDCLWFCHDKHFVIPGTEDMTADYHDYWFHIKGALIGMLLGIPAALVAGIVAML